jgi:nucleotide-binding universal stress UspA family protein
LKILVPHDGSAISDKAFKKAIIFAKELGYEIILLHIIDLELLKADSITKYIHEKSELKKANAQLLTYLKLGSESMLKDKIREAKKENVKVRFILGIGSTPEGIVNVANSENVDFIVIGSRGLSSEGKNEQDRLRILGSVARHVSEIAVCPVMIIK